MDYNAVLNRVRPMLTNGNHLSAQDFEALFGSCSQQEQEHLLAELAVIGILVDTSAAIPSSRKAASFCRSDFTSKQLWSMTNEQLCVLAQQGDESAKEILVRKTAGFVHLMARRIPQREELVAELTAALTAQRYGMTKHLKGDSAAYLKSCLVREYHHQDPGLRIG